MTGYITDIKFSKRNLTQVKFNKAALKESVPTIDITEEDLNNVKYVIDILHDRLLGFRSHTELLHALDLMEALLTKMEGEESNGML